MFETKDAILKFRGAKPDFQEWWNCILIAKKKSFWDIDFSHKTRQVFMQTLMFLVPNHNEFFQAFG